MSEAELLDLLPDAVVIVGADGSIVQMNRAAERLTGWSRAEATGRPWGDVVRLRDTDGHIVSEIADPFTSASPLSAGSPEREYMLHEHAGGDRWVAVRTAYERDGGGKISSVVATIRDTSRRHRLERSAYDLIATLAHDLRSPLTSVKGFTSTMLRNWDRFTEEQKKHMLQTIDWDADRMNRLLKDLLDLSRLEAGRLELKVQPVDVAALAEQVAARVAMDAPKYSISAKFPSAFPVVSADPGKVEQVLVNLVENAVKHGDPGPVTVSGEVQDGMVVIRVADTGPGIDPAHAPYVFTKFYRRGSGDRHAGTGLGLYICKGIIEAHGGEIQIERSTTDGTVFAFSLPRGEG